MAKPWPSFPPLSPNNFLDHFPGSSLDTNRWGSSVSGTGSITVTDSYVDCNAPANSGAFIYLKNKLDKTKSQLITACINRATTGASGNAGFWVVNGSSAPVAAGFGTIEPQSIIQRMWGNQSSLALLDEYFSSGGVNTYWSGSAWTTTYAASLATVIPIQNDDYYILGLEIDGVNQQFRLMAWGQAFVTAGTWTFDQGWRLFGLTDWVPWSSARSSADLWLCLGQMYGDDTSAHEFKIEWVRYGEAPAGNSVINSWNASKGPASGAHRLRHYYSYDGKTFVPQDRTGWALDLGGGAPDNTEINEPWCVYDGVSTDYLFYTGTTGSTKSVCVASAPHVNANVPQNAVFTRYASNPILSLGSAGQFDDFQIGFVCVIKDELEADPNKRWKMLYSGEKNSDQKRRMGYATAPVATGPWTKQGMVLDVGTVGANDASDVWGMVIVRYAGTWEVWYEGHDASGICHLMRATGTDLATLTKDGITYYTPPTSATDQALTANLNTAPGRIVTVGSTAGFQVDAEVILSQENNNDNYSTSTIRKIVSGTQIELETGLTGFTTTYPTRIKQIDSTPGFSPRAIVLVGSEWWFYLNIWEPFFNSPETATYAALLEAPHLFKHSAIAPTGATPAVDYQSSPVVSRGYNNDMRSVDNFTLLNTPVGIDEIPPMDKSNFPKPTFRVVT